ncbi:hypothetical protein B296_00049893 [Ensete ventricosum]|uniref:4-alpha-glucanotransferase n=1 Tax=Ensete ventricosum TaxID=4639 RepID=A0A426Y1J6_ENSVE|nr:hypothetical protein B296_00049893 [Ensete ventricosum]
MLNSGLCPGIKALSSVTLVFRLPYYTHWGQSLLVCGSEPVLGSWNVKQGLALGPSHEGDELIWCGKVAVSVGFSCEYSYYVVDDSRNVLRSEAGNKRRLTLPDAVREGTVVEIHDLWQQAVPWRGAGVAIPMFSVRSSDDLGVGEFLDLKLLVDWAVECGFHLVQLLPVNDTSVHGMWWDSYPYRYLRIST